MNAIAGSSAGIYCGSKFGPCFGVSGRYNLIMSGERSEFKCAVSDAALAFQYLGNVDFRTYFTGSNKFTISELEVFKVSF